MKQQQHRSGSGSYGHAERGHAARKRKSARKALVTTMNDYAATATTHGISYAFDKSLMVIERFIWFVIFCAFFALAIYWTYEQYQKWQDYPIITSVQTTGTTYLSTTHANLYLNGAKFIQG